MRSEWVSVIWCYICHKKIFLSSSSLKGLCLYFLDKKNPFSPIGLSFAGPNYISRWFSFRRFFLNNTIALKIRGEGIPPICSEVRRTVCYQGCGSRSDELKSVWVIRNHTCFWKLKTSSEKGRRKKWLGKHFAHIKICLEFDMFEIGKWTYALWLM